MVKCTSYLSAYKTYSHILFHFRTSIVGAKTRDLDFDGTGGCTFLRVLLSLIIHDYPQLVVGALKLLLKHFSQRQEVLQAFKQVKVVKTDLSRSWRVLVEFPRFLQPTYSLIVYVGKCNVQNV